MISRPTLSRKRTANRCFAELGSKDDLEHLILVDLSNGAHSYLEVGNHFSVGFKI